MDLKAIGNQLGDFSTLVENVNGFFKNLIPAYGEAWDLSYFWIFGS
ncbi:hypothetical protein [Corynebacterium freiburgense]|nr:hypothetical protein [Corynebacterium freiburgense]WJZ03703.1 hypothetical protein CFREI_12230 [Corynebacterium freiburgense]